MLIRNRECAFCAHLPDARSRSSGDIFWICKNSRDRLELYFLIFELSGAGLVTARLDLRSYNLHESYTSCYDLTVVGSHYYIF